jgi:hypothetical protein
MGWNNATLFECRNFIGLICFLVFDRTQLEFEDSSIVGS